MSISVPGSNGSTASTYDAATSYAETVAQTLLGTSYASYVAQYEWASPAGDVSQIPDAEKSVELEIAVLLDPIRILAYKEGIAGQLNAQSNGPTFSDLSERIADVTIETVAQGAGTLTIEIIDPHLVLLTHQDSNGNTFIQADQVGFLAPPIDINFPFGTNCVWRLCQVKASNDLSSPNLTLVFEDAIISELRVVDYSNGGVAQGNPDETLAGFIARMIKGANTYLAATQGTAYVPIKLVTLVSPLDPNYTPPAVPANTPDKTKPLARQHPLKPPMGLNDQQQATVQGFYNLVQGAKHTTIDQAEQNVQQAINNPFSRTL